MRNVELAKIFTDIARFLEIDGVAFKPYAYERASYSIGALSQDVGEIYSKGGVKALMEIPGVGRAIAEHIEEYLKTGKITVYEQYRKDLPVKMDELLKVEGLGPKKIKVLYQKLKVTDLKTLEKAAKAGKIAPLFGFGEKTEQNILQGMEFARRDKGRSLLGEILPVAREVLRLLEAQPEVKKASLAGSLRRMKETIGDVDFLVSSTDTKKTMDFFCNLPGVEKVWGKGGTKASVHMVNGFDMDLRVVPSNSYGSALQYFTGSRDHNIVTRKIAIEKGLKLSEYGIFKGAKHIAGATEEEVYKTLGLPWIAPELRESEGEVEAALANTLPALVELKDIKGDLHCHSNWNGGKHSIEAMAEKAQSLGYEYIGISDHTQFLKIEKGLTGKQLLQQRREIQKLNSKFETQNSKFKILQGCEANILNDGSIDIKDDVLAQLDYVIAGVHSVLKMPKKAMMARIVAAMKNPHVDIISHPTGRLIGRREEYQHDFDEMLAVAKRTGTILEINASPYRLDLRDLYIRRAKEAGVPMIINTDAHQKEQMDLMEYGIYQARRGWAGPEHIINTRPIEELLTYFN